MAVIVCDIRERVSTVPAWLRGLGVDVEWASLATADYAIGRTVLVERKSVLDLHGSIMRGRFWPQVGRLKVAVLQPYLLVEGRDLDAGPLSPNAIRGCLVAAADNGLRLLRSSDARDTALWLHRLAVRHGDQPPRIDKPAYAQRPKPPDPERTAEAILASVPGISTHLARELIARFGNLNGVLNATPQDWATVKGIGRRRANALSAVFGSRDAASVSSPERLANHTRKV